MKTYSDQITIYFNPTNSKHKKTVAHAKSAGKVLAIPFEEMPTANNAWTDIYQELDGKVMEIFNAEFLEERSVQPTTFEDWYKIVTHNLGSIESPIAVKGEKVLICNQPTDIYKLGAPKNNKN